MDFDRLRAFVCTLEEGNISGAARRLYRTQPAVTRMLQTLEEPRRLRAQRSPGATHAFDHCRERPRRSTSFATAPGCSSDGCGFRHALAQSLAQMGHRLHVQFEDAAPQEHLAMVASGLGCEGFSRECAAS